MKKLKIALVNKFFFLKGGADRVMFDEADVLEKNGHEVVFFSMKHPNNIRNYELEEHFVDYVELSQLGKEYGWFKKLKISLDIIYNRKNRENFEKFLLETKPDIIHCHNITSQISPSILHTAKKLNIPVVLTLHDYSLICPCYTLLKSGKEVCREIKCSKGNYLNCFINKCTKNSFKASFIHAMQGYFNYFTGVYKKNIIKFISPSIFLKNIFLQDGFKKEHIEIVPNFVDIEKYTPSFQDKGFFLFAGRLSYEKGLFTLLKAFESLPKSCLKILGTGPIGSELRDYAIKKGLNNVEFLGYKSGEELKEYYKNCKAVIIPSEWYENAPITILEAFAFAKPVIGSKIGGITEMIEHLTNGCLFEAGNHQELSDYIQKLNSDSSLAMELGKNARQKAENQYDAQFHYKKLMAVYQAAINQ